MLCWAQRLTDVFMCVPPPPQGIVLEEKYGTLPDDGEDMTGVAFADWEVGDSATFAWPDVFMPGHAKH